MLPLNQILKEKLIKWAGDGLDGRLIVARAEMKRSARQPEVKIRKKKISGKRVAIRNKRQYGYRLFSAEWPEDQLHELTAPKLICVLKGVTDYVAGEYVITCGQEHIILLPPLMPNISGVRPNIDRERSKDEFCELLQILVARDYVHCMYSIENSERIQEVMTHNCIIYNLQAVRLFDDFMELALVGENFNEELQQHLLSAFFWVVVNEIDAGHEINTFFKSPQLESPTYDVGELRDYIKTNLRHSLTIEKVARHMYMSPRQFTRYWRQKTGQSFVETLTECRLEESKRLLESTHWTIEGIAFLVGFKNATYFSTFFKNQTGLSPSNYREKISSPVSEK